MRCLSLAAMLKSISDEIYFACLPQHGDAISLIRERGFAVYILTPPLVQMIPANDKDYQAWLQRSVKEDVADFIGIACDADLVVTDHYAIGAEWHKKLKSTIQCKVVAIDDLVREHDADLVIDQTLGRKPNAYHGASRLLAGPEYALLALPFARHHEDGLNRTGLSGRPRVLIYVGSGDVNNVTLKVLETLVGVIDAHFTVLVSKVAVHYTSIKSWAEGKANVEHLEFVDDMAELMLKNDISIGAAGTTSWERACVGLPSILIPVADNQVEICGQFVKAGAAKSVAMDAIQSQLVSAVRELLEEWDAYTAANLAICDGRGAYRALLEISCLMHAQDCAAVELVAATEDDIELVYRWQLAPETRKFALNPALPSWNEHKDWMNDKLKQNQNYFYIIRDKERASSSGVLRLDRQYTGTYLVSILVDPECHGRGIARSALSVADRIFPDFTLKAVVLEANRASQRLFENAGYQRLTNEEFSRKPLA